MKPQTRQSRSSLLVVSALATILVLLALLQYRWSGRISEAERTRMQTSLNTSVSMFRGELIAEFRRICGAFQFDPPDFPGNNWQRYAERYRFLPARDARLAAGMFIWDFGAEPASSLLRLDATSGRFEPAPWPRALEVVRGDLRLGIPPGPGQDPRSNNWMIVEKIPLLLFPLAPFAPPSRAAEEGPRLFGCLMIELDPEVLWRELIPELAHRYFGGEQGITYQIAIVNGTAEDRVLYQSDTGLPLEFFINPDARVSLLPGPRDFLPRPAEAGPGPPPRPPGSVPGEPSPAGPGGRPGPASGRPRSAVAIMPVPGGDSWTLLVRHNAGPLGEVVAAQRRRNLAISFGILILLGLSMAMIILSTRRAQRLAKLQMDFVAGISHELRTPLAVICSAADNLAEGIVAASQEHVRQYGDLIRQEGRRLTGMVEQILAFAGSQERPRKYDLHPAQAGQLVESLLSKLRSTIDHAGFTLETEIGSDLPRVKVDEAVLSRCLENLINNALKYGGRSRWMKVCVAGAAKGGVQEVQISVEDKGMGIERADLPHIFDPFYRAATAAQTHGSGLGLSLAQEGVVAMGGRISVKSTPDVGSVFIIHLPVLTAEEEHVVGKQAS